MTIPRVGRPSNRGSFPGRDKTFFTSSTKYRPGLTVKQPRISGVPGALPPGIKRPGHEDNHKSLSSVEVKNTWIYCFPTIRLHDLDRDNFSFVLFFFHIISFKKKEKSVNAVCGIKGL